VKEQAIQSKIIHYIERDLDGYVVKIIKASKSGICDLICCVSGRFVGIEVKKPTTMGTVSPLQLVNIDLIKQSGGVAFVACSVDDVREQLEPLPV
jgi:hypothetical protein